MICVIIDSGLSNKYINNERIIGKMAFHLEDNKIKTSKDIQDEDGHGSACFHILNKYTKNCHFYIIKILKNGNSDIRLLYEALKHCLKIKCDIINLSLSADLKENDVEDLEKIPLQILKNRILMIASYSNNKSNGYPANNKNVIGIDGVMFDNNECYYVNYSTGKLDFTFNIFPEVTKRENGKYYFFAGNSKATALATAKIINTLRCKEDFNIETVYCLLKDSKLDKVDFCRDLKMHEKITKNISATSRLYKKICNILYKLSGREIEIRENLVKSNILLPDNLSDFVNALEQEMGIKINDEKLMFSDFLSVDNIVNMVVNNGKY